MITWSVYDKEHMSELRIKNRMSERDLRSCEVTQLQIKPRKNPHGIWTHDLRDTDALPTDLWSLVGNRSGASSIYTRYMKRVTSIVYYDKDHIFPQLTHIIFIMYTSRHSLYTTGINWTRTWPQARLHRTGFAEVMGSNPVGASEYFLGSQLRRSLSPLFTSVWLLLITEITLLRKLTEMHVSKLTFKPHPVFIPLSFVKRYEY